MNARRALLALAACIAAIPVAPAHADDAIAEVLHETPLAGYGGWSAWSRASGDRFQLVLRNPQGTLVIPDLPTSSRPWDVSLGPDTFGNVNAIYQRCTARGCDIRRLNTATGREEILDDVSSPSFREATPALWRSTVAFTRSVRGCDVPYVKTLGSRAPSRRLLRGRCVRTDPGHLTIRGTRIVVSSLTDTDDLGPGGPQTSEVRRYSARRGGPASAVLLKQGFGDELNLFGQVSIDEHHVTTVRYGERQPHAFVRVRTFGGTPAEVRAHTLLTGEFAKTSDGTSLYGEAQHDETDDETDSGIAPARVPRRIVQAVHSPFGRRERALAPRLTVEYVTDRPGPRQDRPLPFRGRLTRSVVQDGRVVRADPVPGLGIKLLRRTIEERFEDTPYRGVTGPDGSYEIVVPPPIPREPWFTAVAATPAVPTWAGRGTEGQTAP